ncbi:hypothetical protein JOH51_007290 [Rhizobium leguminosarum]|nr:hypothetical protein [Rhizobium leguminosarum]
MGWLDVHHDARPPLEEAHHAALFEPRIGQGSGEGPAPALLTGYSDRECRLANLPTYQRNEAPSRSLEVMVAGFAAKVQPSLLFLTTTTGDVNENNMEAVLIGNPEPSSAIRLFSKQFCGMCRQLFPAAAIISNTVWR